MWFHLNLVVLVRVSNERKMLIVQHWENTTRQQCENRRSSRGHQKKIKLESVRERNRTNVKSHNTTNSTSYSMNYTVWHERVLEANTMYHEVIYFSFDFSAFYIRYNFSFYCAPCYRLTQLDRTGKQIYTTPCHLINSFYPVFFFFFLLYLCEIDSFEIRCSTN